MPLEWIDCHPLDRDHRRIGGNTGGGDLSYTVTPNKTASPRSGTIQINEQTYSVTQDGDTLAEPGITFTVPPGLAPGTKYRLVFVTANSYYAFSTDISIYNATVNNEAAAQSLLAALGTSWLCICSTASKNAMANIGQDTGVPIYNLDGRLVATDATLSSGGLFSGSLINPVDYDEFGDAAATFVFTGSIPVGSEDPDYALGDSNSPTIVGASGDTSSNWLFFGALGSPRPLYAISEVLTVPGGGIQFTAQSVVNGATFLSGQVAPGELITIFGSGLGPATPTFLQTTPDGQYVTTSLGGTRVLFDGMPAPVTFVSATQVNAIVPFELVGAVSTQVVVEVQGIASSPITESVTPSSPAIFAVSGGSGQATALNQDNSANSPSNPATVGTVLQVFATGFGQTTPPGVNGQVAGSTASLPILRVTATIGGINAPVQYAGSSNGLVAGVTQVNVLVPAGVTAGNAVPLVLSIAGNPTVSGTTIAIVAMSGMKFYRLAFVTANVFSAPSTNISTYNADVNNEARAEAALAALGTSWLCICSTASKNAIDNIGQDPGVPIYNMDGQLVATDATTNSGGLFSGSIINPIAYTESGAQVNSYVYTGTLIDGTFDPGYSLGSQPYVMSGRSYTPSSSWVEGTLDRFGSPSALYAISGVLTTAPSGGIVLAGRDTLAGRDVAMHSGTPPSSSWISRHDIPQYR